MIKNILYSLFLHLILAFFIYINFRIIKNEIIEVDRGISVGVVSFRDDKDSTEIAKNEEKPSQIVKKPTPKIIKKAEKTEKIVKKSSKKAEKAISKPKKEEDLIKKTEVKKEEEERHQEEKMPEVKKEEETTESAKEEEKSEEIREKPPQMPKEEENSAIDDKTQEKQKLYTDEEIIDDLEEINLSAREKFNIQTQLRGCFRRASESNPAPAGLEMVVNIKTDKDGTIDFDFDNFIDIKRYEDPKEINYKKMADNVAQALELCNPLRNLPIDKYDNWKAFSIRFSSQ